MSRDKQEPLTVGQTYFILGAFCGMKLLERIYGVDDSLRSILILVFNGVQFEKVINSQANPLHKIRAAIWLDAREMALDYAEVSLAIELYPKKYENERLKKRIKVQEEEIKKEKELLKLKIKQENEKFQKKQKN